MQQFVDAFEGRVHHDRAGRLAGHIAGRTHRDAHRRRRERRSIVDPVADKQGRRLGRRLLHDLQFALRLDAGMHLGDADQIGEPADLALAVAGDEHHAGEPVGRFQMADERPAIGPRRVAEAEQGLGLAVHHDHAFEPAGHGRQLRDAGGIDIGQFLTAGDRHVVHRAAAIQLFHLADEPLSGLLGQGLHIEQAERFLRGGLHHGCGERVLRIGFETGGQRQHVRPGQPAEEHDVGEAGLAVGERARLVEDRDPAGVEPFEDGRIADHDATLGGQRHGPDDRHRDRDQERAGGGDDEHREKPCGAAAEPPGGGRDRHGQRRVEGAEPVGHPPQLRPVLLARTEHVHDLGVAAVAGHAVGANLKRGLPVDRAREHGRPGSLRHAVGLAGEVALVHRPAARHHSAVHRADLVRQDDDRVADSHLREHDVGQAGGRLAMGERRHPPGQGVEHVAGPADGTRFERLTPREHQHNEHAGEVFTQENARDDRQAGQQVGAKRARKELAQQIPDQRHAPRHEHYHQRQIGKREAAAGKPAAGIERAERHRLSAPARPGDQGPGRQGKQCTDRDQFIDRQRA